MKLNRKQIRMKKPKVCFLATVYNGQTYIAEAIESMLHQTMKDIEVIYVDDGSTDHTSDILMHYSSIDDRFRYYTLPSNVGISVAWNYGLKKVKAPVICISSADDVYTDYRAELSYKKLSQGKYDAVYGAYLRSHESISDIQQGLLIDGSSAGMAEVVPYYKGMNKDKQRIPHGFMSITTEMAKKVLYREHLKVGIDYPFIIDLEKAGCRFTWTKKVLGIYRLHKENVSFKRIAEVDIATKEAQE